jgi:hypothetical protein
LKMMDVSHHILETPHAQQIPTPTCLFIRLSIGNQSAF